MQVAEEWGQPMRIKRGGEHDYMMRSERRPSQPQAQPPRRRRRRPARSVGYAILTILLLIVLYPVGLIMLWLPRLSWRAGTKLLLTLTTAVLFFLLLAFALTTQFSDPTLTAIQGHVKNRLETVVDVTRDAVSNRESIEENLTVNGPKALALLAQGAQEELTVRIPAIERNLKTVFSHAGRMGKAIVGRVDHEAHEFLYQANLIPTPSPTPAATATPVATEPPAVTPEPGGTVPPATEAPSPAATQDDLAASGTQPPLSAAATPEPAGATPGLPREQTTVSGVPTPDVSGQESPSTRQTPGTTSPPASARQTEVGTATPAGTAPAVPELTLTASPEPKPAMAIVPTPTRTPIATPTQTPRPTPSPTPIVLPSPKPFGESEVYYYDQSRSYHLTPNCGSMKNAPGHTLTEAAAAGKPRCASCKPPDIALLAVELVVWCGEDGAFHITDECAGLVAPVKALPFEEAWLEDGMTGCPLCGSDLYIEAQRLNPVTTPVPAPIQPVN